MSRTLGRTAVRAAGHWSGGRPQAGHWSGASWLTLERSSVGHCSHPPETSLVGQDPLLLTVVDLVLMVASLAMAGALEPGAVFTRSPLRA